MTCGTEPAAVWPAKDPAEKLDYAVNFERSLSRFWRSGESHTTTQRVRPNKPDGFEYECTSAGQTGDREPKFTATTTPDGSVVWTRRALSAASLVTTIVGTPTWTPPTGIAVSGESIANNITVAFIEDGVDGHDYSVLITATCADGTIRSKVCILPVRRAKRVC